jgi:hypothetical protein
VGIFSVGDLSSSLPLLLGLLLPSPMMVDIDTCKPFGRAFYRHEANYYVLRMWQIVIYSTFGED